MSIPVSRDRLADALDKLLTVDRPRYRRLWAYYRNPMRPADALGAEDKPYRQAQEWGLPTRITGYRAGQDVSVAHRITGAVRKEVVIENDIAWRVETMVEYLFGKPLVVASAAPDPQRREIITELLRHVLAGNGGMLFLQQLALVGSVHGFVDVLVKLDLARLNEYRTTGRCDADASCGDLQTLGQAPVGAPNEPKELASQGPAPVSSEEVRPASSDAADARDGDELASEPADPAEPADPSLDLSEAIQPPAPSAAVARRALAQLARLVRFEMIEPARALPFLSEDDYRVVECYGQVYEIQKPVARRREPTAEPAAFIDRLYRAALNRLKPPPISFTPASGVKTVQVVELLTADTWHRLEDGKLICSGINSLGELPLVHIQNLAVPFEYAGASDVEPLIPLQDELNTRLSDRAHRITMQSFKMYLGKGIENFAEMPVAPGRMWATDNTDADVIEFGGDAHNPSEESHIAEIREALDKTSGVSPVAAGGVKNKLGHLTSAAALRVTMQSLLSKTEKKRIGFGVAISRMCELALAWLDTAGVFATSPDERRVELHWANPLPIADGEALDEARAKLRLGIPKDVVARELGY